MNTKDLLRLYVNNSRDVYMLTEWLASCIEKKKRRNQRFDIMRLASCPTMRRLVNLAARLVFENEGVNVSLKDKKEIREEHAAYILETV